jgi:hypothetical protein
MPYVIQQDIIFMALLMLTSVVVFWGYFLWDLGGLSGNFWKLRANSKIDVKEQFFESNSNNYCT